MTCASPINIYHQSYWIYQFVKAKEAMSSLNIQEQLMYIDSTSKDRQLCQEYSFMTQMLMSTIIKNDIMIEEVSEEMPEEDQEEESEVDKEEQSFHQKWLEVEQQHLAQECSTQDIPITDSVQTENKRSRTTRASQKLSSNYLSNDEDLEDDDDNMSSYSKGEKTNTIQRQTQKKGSPKQAYPTKNYLAFLKSPHLNYLIRYFGKDQVKRFDVVKRMLAKNGSSMQDYQDLYKITEFQKPFTVFFDNQVLLRELMISRSQMSQKLNYRKKINVPKKAFKTKLFAKIN